MSNPLTLRLLPEKYAVCRLEANAPIPAWALVPGPSLVSITRTRSELSLVAPQLLVKNVEGAVFTEWRAFEVAGPLDFALVGILAGLTAPLADAQIPLFAISTFDTDYLLVREQFVTKASEVWQAEGHMVVTVQ